MESVKRRKIRAFDVFLALLMTVLAFCFIIPFWIIFVTSLSDNLQLMRNGISLWFQGFTWRGYEFLFQISDKFLRSMGVSLLTSVVTAVLSVFTCTLAAYALSKKYLVGRKFFNIFLMIPMFFSGGTIPTYLIVRGIGLYNTVWALILPGATSVYQILLMRNYFYGITDALEEAAYLDGAGDLAVLWRIYLPLSVPMMCTIGCMTFVGKWNEWLPSLLYIGAGKEHLWTVQYVLRQMLQDMKTLIGDEVANAPTIAAQNAAIVLVVLPLILLSPILHKYFSAGLTVGSVKG